MIVTGQQRSGVDAFNPNTQEMEAGGSGVQGYPLLHNKFVNSLVYVRHCQKTKQNPSNKAISAFNLLCGKILKFNSILKIVIRPDVVAEL